MLLRRPPFSPLDNFSPFCLPPPPPSYSHPAHTHLLAFQWMNLHTQWLPHFPGQLCWPFLFCPGYFLYMHYCFTKLLSHYMSEILRHYITKHLHSEFCQPTLLPNPFISKWYLQYVLKEFHHYPPQHLLFAWHIQVYIIPHHLITNTSHLYSWVNL